MTREFASFDRGQTYAIPRCQGSYRRGSTRSFHFIYTDPQTLQRDATNAVVVEFLP